MIGDLGQVTCPGFVKLLKPASIDEITNCDLIPGIIYVFTAKGWDMKNEGKEILKIDGLGWIPASSLEIVKGIVPN